VIVQLICTMIPLCDFMLSHGDSMPLSWPCSKTTGNHQVEQRREHRSPFLEAVEREGVVILCGKSK
jgi:hypothetical protein